MTPPRLSTLRRAARRLRRDDRGVALLEFALSLPIVITLGLSGAEITNYIITRMRVSQIALQLADNAARIGSGSMLQAKTITEGDVNDLLTGAGYQGGELDLYGHGRVIVSSLEPVASPNTTNKYKIGWQRCRGTKIAYKPGYGEEGKATGKNMNGMGPAGHQVIAPDTGGTMFVEVYYDYQPIIDLSWLFPDGGGTGKINEYASMMIRDRRDMTQVYPAAGETKSGC